MGLYFTIYPAGRESSEEITSWTIKGVLSEQYEIFITTAAMEFPSSFTAKYEWLKEHFSFLSEMNFVFCGNKSIIHADYLIDDNVRHFKRFAGQGILFTSPHNINETGFVRVNNWLEVKGYFLK